MTAARCDGHCAWSGPRTEDAGAAFAEQRPQGVRAQLGGLFDQPVRTACAEAAAADGELQPRPRPKHLHGPPVWTGSNHAPLPVSQALSNVIKAAASLCWCWALSSGKAHDPMFKRRWAYARKPLNTAQRRESHLSRRLQGFHGDFLPSACRCQPRKAQPPLAIAQLQLIPLHGGDTVLTDGIACSRVAHTTART